MDMEMVHARCAGLDVHKTTIVTCLRCLDEQTGEFRVEIRSHESNTRGLLALLDWLQSEGVTHVAMESTGVYWKPVYNILDGHFDQLLVVNAAHIKQVPGRKTDVKDCEWIAKLVQHGLLRGSYVPEKPVREWRDATRTRAKYIGDQTRVKNRIQKILEDGNIKLGCVASDVFGVSGRAMLNALANGETDASRIADLARGRLRAKKPELRSALHGQLTEHHRFMLKVELQSLKFLERTVEKFERHLDKLMRPFEKHLTLLTTIPGVKRRVAQTLLAEVGPDMSRFPTAKHLASWTGICPGNAQSAGKRKSGKPAKGNVWARRVLTEAAWAASKVGRSYLSAQFRRLVGKRGKKRAIVAVGHTIIIAVWHMLSGEHEFRDLGANYFDDLHRKKLQAYYLRRLKELGLKVSVVPADLQGAGDALPPAPEAPSPRDIEAPSPVPASPTKEMRPPRKSAPPKVDAKAKRAKKAVQPKAPRKAKKAAVPSKTKKRRPILEDVASAAPAYDAAGCRLTDA